MTPDFQKPLLRRGTCGEAVKTLQYMLRAHGRTLTVDGNFGSITEQAVRTFQQSVAIAVDGIVGNQTWSKVLKTVTRGDRGDAVRAVQSQFVHRDLSDNPDLGFIDGIFGPKTDGKVRGLQEALQLQVDGIAGPVTWSALLSGALEGSGQAHPC